MIKGSTDGDLMILDLKDLMNLNGRIESHRKLKDGCGRGCGRWSVKTCGGRWSQERRGGDTC